MAKSFKNKNYCVAGIDPETGKWVRIVSEDEDTLGALTESDVTYADGTECQVLDIVQFPIKEEVPTKRQPENVLLHRGYPIVKDGAARLEDVLRIHPAENHRLLFGNRYNSIKEEYLEESGINYSLVLVKVDHLIFNYMQNKEGKTKFKASCVFNGNTYEEMSVTDPEYYNADGDSEISSAYIVVSIGAPYNGRHYKFIASIFPDEQLSI